MFFRKHRSVVPCFLVRIKIRFIDSYDLRSEVQRALIATLKQKFSIEPSAEEVEGESSSLKLPLLSSLR